MVKLKKNPFVDGRNLYLLMRNAWDVKTQASHLSIKLTQFENW